VITVLTTVRNGMPFIVEAVESARGQTRKDIEHCVVNDGSTDRTLEFLKQRENRELEVIDTDPVGRGRALNMGVRHSQAEWLAILDADDVAAPCWLASMVKTMESHPEIAVLSCSGMLSKEEMDVGNNEEIRPYRLTHSAFLYRNPVHHSGTIIRKQSLLEVGGYDETRDCLFDYDLWIRLLKNGKQIWRVDNGYIFKRIHAGQHFERNNRLHYLLEAYKIRRVVCVALLGKKFSPIPVALFLYGLLPRWLRMGMYRRRKQGGAI